MSASSCSAYNIDSFALTLSYNSLELSISSSYKYLSSIKGFFNIIEII